MARPRGIDITFWVMCVTNAMRLLYLKPKGAHFIVLLMANLITVAIVSMVLLFYRKGENWARWFFLLGAFFSVVAIRGLWHPYAVYNAFLPVMIVLRALIGGVLLVYLNLPRTRAWFLAQSRVSHTSRSAMCGIMPRSASANAPQPTHPPES